MAEPLQQAPVGEAARSYDSESARAHYETHLAPLIEGFEAKRVEAQARYRKRIPFGLFVMVVVVAVAGLLLFSGWTDDNIIFPLVIVVAGAAMTYAYVTHPLGVYLDNVRAEVYPRIFSFFGADYSYRRDCPWSVNSLNDSDLIPGFDNEKLEDYVRGAYKSVPVEMVEAYLTKETGSGDKKRTTTVFDGVLFVLTPRKRFSGKIVVRQDSGFIGNAFMGFVKDKFQHLETVRVEDPEFEDKFQVYATDQIEARKVLTPSFMQRLLDLAKILGDGDVDCSFFDDKLLIRVATSHDFFEPSSPYEPVDFHRDFQTIVEEMRTVFDIIDTLKLDQDIGL